MPSFSEKSLKRLNTCHRDLVRLFLEVVKHFDCTVVEGHRSKDKQDKYFKLGVSKKEWPEGAHNKVPSDGVDVIPYPVDWADSHRHCLFAGFVKGTAIQMGIDIRWGGDWDSDTQVNDQTFNDRVHFERVK